MRKLLILAVAAVTIGCATASGPPVYRRAAPFAGYTDRHLGNGVWHVTYFVTGTYAWEYPQTYALYRAAELAHQARYPFFQMVRFSGQNQMRGGSIVSGKVEMTIRGARSMDEELKCENKGGTGCRTFSTEETLRRLEPKIVRPPVSDQGGQPPA